MSGFDSADPSRIARTAALLRPWWRRHLAEQKGQGEPADAQASKPMSMSTEGQGS